MAHVVAYMCIKCGKHEHEAIGAGSPTPTTCSECRKKETDQKRILHFQGLNGLSLEERVRRIEEWIYDYKVPINIRDARF